MKQVVLNLSQRRYGTDSATRSAKTMARSPRTPRSAHTKPVSSIVKPRKPTLENNEPDENVHIPAATQFVSIATCYLPDKHC